MGSWVLSLRTLNGKTNLTLASLKFTKKCNNNNNNSENYKDCRVQRHSVTVFSYMGAVKKNNWNSHACWNTTREKAAPEMPTSGDLKSGDCLFLHYPPGISTTPPPKKKKIDPAPNGNDLGHYMASYMMYVLSKFEIIVLMLEIIFVND